MLDLGYPLGILLVPGYAWVAGCISARLTSILLVLLLCDGSQIRDSIICLVTVNVAYLVFRPLSVNIEPSKPVGFVESAL